MTRASRPTITRTGLLVVACLVSVLGTVCRADDPEEFKIGIVDLYGLNRVSAAQVREALTFKEGDTILLADSERPAMVAASEERLSKTPGIARAQITVTCCDQGRVIMFVGVEESGTTAKGFHAAPRGTERLAADIVQSGEEFSTASTRAVERGDTAEDRSEGHALRHDPATRAVQERFVELAKRDLPQLRLVLRSSSDAAQRALAAQVLGYAPDKQAVVEDLVQAMRDPSEGVRNNAMRALVVFAETKPSASRTVPRIPPEPFIDLLSSLAWSDRNKASLALMALSASRDAHLLARLRKDALTPLVEMARWKSAGHAFGAFMILGRIAGYSDDAAHDLWDHGNREKVIEAAIRR
jgi:hypothetical protein